MENNCLHDETVILVLSALTWLYTVLKLGLIIRSVRFFFSFFFFQVISLLHPWVTCLPGCNGKTWAFICLFCDYFALEF